MLHFAVAPFPVETEIASMIHVENWEERKKRYEEYWSLKNRTPILYVTSPSEKRTEADPGPCRNRWRDCEYHCRAARADFLNTYYGGDAYPYYLPDLGFDVATSMLGIEIEVNEVSAWAVHSSKSLAEFTDFSFQPENAEYQAMVRALEYYIQDARNETGDVDYLVGMIPFNTLYDGIASMIGPDRLCLEMMDHPEEVHRVAREHFELFKKVYTVFEKQTLRYQHGSTNWLGVYSDIPWYYISNDFIVMLSEDFFQEFILETLLKTVEFHPRTLFHLDGENAVRHLSALLKIPKLTGIQVQATPFRQSAEFWTPYLRRIQSAGKAAWIEARHFDDLKYLVEHLEPEGLFIKTYADSEAEAKRMERFVREYYGSNGL